MAHGDVRGAGDVNLDTRAEDAGFTAEGGRFGGGGAQEKF
jgi:hypothetical protein